MMTVDRFSTKLRKQLLKARGARLRLAASTSRSTFLPTRRLRWEISIFGLHFC